MKITVSTVTPVYKGELCLQELVHELSLVRDSWSEAAAPLALVEAIFVDDGSIDRSAEVLKGIEQQFDWVRVIELSKNFGQHAATCAGICHTSSDWVVTLDEDLQHHPADINALFRQQANQSSDIVYANARGSAHGNSWRDKLSVLVKKIMARITSTPQISMFNSFRLIRGSIARAAASSSSSQTYLDVAISWFTSSCSSLELDLKDKRYIKAKESGYSFTKLLGHARKLLISSQVDIAMGGIVVGIFAILVATLIGGLSLIQKVFIPETIGLPGWASIVALLTFFAGVTIALLCIIIEYLNVNVVNQLGKPNFFAIDRSNDAHIRDWFRKERS